MCRRKIHLTKELLQRSYTQWGQGRRRGEGGREGRGIRKSVAYDSQSTSSQTLCINTIFKTYPRDGPQISRATKREHWIESEPNTQAQRGIIPKREDHCEHTQTHTHTLTAPATSSQQKGNSATTSHGCRRDTFIKDRNNYKSFPALPWARRTEERRLVSNERLLVRSSLCHASTITSP